MRRILYLIALALAAVAITASGTGFSSASFTAVTTNSASVQASADWTPPTVSVSTTATVVSGTTAVTAQATDGETGIAQVEIQYAADGSSNWTRLCLVTTGSGSTYSCSWNTTLVADGIYDLRAIATDRATPTAYTTISDVVEVRVTQNFEVVLNDPGDVVRGTVPVSAYVTNSQNLSVASVEFQYQLGGTGPWIRIATDSSAPFAVSWPTSGTNLYDLRAVANVGPSTYMSVVVTDVLVDNVNPASAVMTNPGTPLSGTRTFTATAQDNESGIAQVEIQYAGSTGGFKTLCTVTAAPYSCGYDTTQLAYGSYSFRAIATDLAGNTLTSTVVSGIVIDNTISSVGMNDPGAVLNGSVLLSATANSNAGVTSVRIQRAPTGTTTWVDVCTFTATPYSCTWDSKTVADGYYDFRAVLLDRNAQTTYSTTVSNRRVLNAAITGRDIQTGNGGTVTGRADPKDTLTFTYSGQVQLSSIAAGLTVTTPKAVTVRLRDFTNDDILEVFSDINATIPVNLGSVNLKQNYVKKKKMVLFNATMSATVTGGQTIVTITLGTVTQNSTSRATALIAATMEWTPSSSAVGATNGVPVNPVLVKETGPLDKEF